VEIALPRAQAWLRVLRRTSCTSLWSGHCVKLILVEIRAFRPRNLTQISRRRIAAPTAGTSNPAILLAALALAAASRTWRHAIERSGIGKSSPRNPSALEIKNRKWFHRRNSDSGRFSTMGGWAVWRNPRRRAGPRDAQRVGGLPGWSGNTQRLPPIGVDGLLACGSPQFCDWQSRSQNPAVHAIFCKGDG
jgi:hypothetical protein